MRGEPECLASCYRRCLELADERGASSLTLPSISTGVYGYPLAEAADIALSAAERFLQQKETSLQKVSFVLFGRPAFDIFAAAARRLFDGGGRL